MSMEIKFRAWLIEEEQMVFSDCQCSSNREEIWNFYGTGLHVELQETIHREGGGEVHEEIRYVEVPQKIVQFTGLKDKNGADIYEGDILSVCNGSINCVPCMETPIEVKKNGRGEFNLPFFCWGEDGSNDMDSTHWCEVIGNIHQNPELLSQ